MVHLTRKDIEQRLLAGTAVPWTEAGGKKNQLILGKPSERRLCRFLLSSSVRSSTGLSDTFIKGLRSAFEAKDDPATTAALAVASKSPALQWRLESIETEGFGGLNAWQKPPLKYYLDCDSLLLEGPNGSGKSSFTGAIVWALSGERPRDQTSTAAHEARAVYGATGQEIGEWPPLATYPPNSSALKSDPNVRVRLQFRATSGQVAAVERTLVGGVSSVATDPSLEIPSSIIETGIVMPTRLAMLRLDEGRGRLTDAVQTLTGLDDLIAIGALAEGLCHKAREYRSYMKKELANSSQAFQSALETARKELTAVDVVVDNFAAADTSDPQGLFSQLTGSVNAKAQELAEVIASDISPSLNLALAASQSDVIGAIAAAREHVAAGLTSIPFWRTISGLADICSPATEATLTTAMAAAKQQLIEAIALRDLAQKDSRFRLKALAAAWHDQHEGGPIDQCPLCSQSLDSDPALREELESLKASGATAARTFEDAIVRIRGDLDIAVPTGMRSFTADVLNWQPREKLEAGLRSEFVTKDRYSNVLVRFAAIVDSAIPSSPSATLEAVAAPNDAQLSGGLPAHITTIERLLELSRWFRLHSSEWLAWWKAVSDAKGDAGAVDGSSAGPSSGNERLVDHLTRLTEALNTSGPYRRAATALKVAESSGAAATAIENELTAREQVAESLMSLKALGPLCESIARETITRLSSSMAKLLSQIHLTEQLHFRDARLERKDGLVVHAGFVPGLQIDATLVANTSWLRAILWALIFAMRDEAVGQLGGDPLPVFVFDDPQQTFDIHHRHRWAQYIASLQSSPSKAQVILTTYDETFLHLIKAEGVSGRDALIAPVGDDLDHIAVVEGGHLDRLWSEATQKKSAEAGRAFMIAARIHVESILKLILRGETYTVGTSVVGSCRAKLEHLNSGGGGLPPWNRAEIVRLVGALGHAKPEVRYMEIAHHADGAHLGMGEAEKVHNHLKKSVLAALGDCFRLVRIHQLLHGGLKALHAAAPSSEFPEGFKTSVRAIPLQILGRAAALTDGRVSDGKFNLDEFEASDVKKIVLAQHSAYRLTSRTLEPVARPGDLLLVHDTATPSERSLVVALHHDRIVARRFVLAEDHSDVAVLAAQAINPYHIAAPIVSQKATTVMRKVVGVLYDDAGPIGGGPPGGEITACPGESVLAPFVSAAFGLVEVVGSSAEPRALDGQYLMLKKEVFGTPAIMALNGKPVVAADTEGNRYFKRLRTQGDKVVVLESLDSSGEYEPIVLAFPGSSKTSLERLWPVAGVLFEL